VYRHIHRLVASVMYISYPCLVSSSFDNLHDITTSDLREIVKTPYASGILVDVSRCTPNAHEPARAKSLEQN
jgi:hypothetical protein